jgi:hypothetical protein
MRVLDVAVADAPAPIVGNTFGYAPDEETALKLKPRVFACLLAHYVDPAPADAAVCSSDRKLVVCASARD